MIDDAPQRLFIAAWPPLDVAQRFADATRRSAGPGIRPVPVDNLHITLRFLGTVHVSVAAAALASADLPRAEVRIDDIARWLDTRQLVVPASGVDELARAVRDGTAAIGEPDRRDFFGHITLARAKTQSSTPIAAQPFAERFPVDEVRLVASRTLPTGAVYETVATINLQ